jgi:hypothetical protein
LVTGVLARGRGLLQAPVVVAAASRRIARPPTAIRLSTASMILTGRLTRGGRRYRGTI